MEDIHGMKVAELGGSQYGGVAEERDMFGIWESWEGRGEDCYRGEKEEYRRGGLEDHDGDENASNSLTMLFRLKNTIGTLLSFEVKSSMTYFQARIASSLPWQCDELGQFNAREH